LNHTRLMFHWVVLLTMLAAPASLSDCCGPHTGRDPLCGPKSLLLVSSKLGVVADLDELTQLAEATETGTTMSGLQKAAKLKGLQAVGVKLSVDELAASGVMAICHLWGNHFVVAVRGSTGIEVTDPSAEEGDQQLSIEDFRNYFSGFALLISKDPINLPAVDDEIPDLRVDAFSYDLGSVDEGSKVDALVEFRNVGKKELVISQVRPSCTCLELERIEKNVQPGGRGSIAVTYDSTGMRGGQVHRLFIESNDPVSPLAVVEIGALAKPSNLLVSSRRIHFGEVDASLGATREIFVKDPGDASLDISEVLSDSKLLDVCLAGEAKPEIEINESVFPVLVTLRPGLPLGAFEGSVTIVSNHPKEPRLQIPVVAMVKGDIEVSPEALFLGFAQEGQILSKSVTLRACTPRVFAIESVCTSSDLFSVEISPKAVGREYVATVSLKDTAPAGLIKGEVHFHTDSPLQPTVAVPLHALVEDREERTAERPSSEPTRDGIAQSPVVRGYVFTSEGCTHCEVVSNDNIQAIAAKLGCRAQIRYFDVENMANWRKLTDLEREYHDTDNEMPVVFIGTEVLGGEHEVTEMLESVIAMYAGEGGSAWPEEIDQAP